MCWSLPTQLALRDHRSRANRVVSGYTIGIVTHGGIQDPSWTHGPPWELETAYMMRHEGFDSVIAYNWAASEQHARRGDQAVAKACADDPRRRQQVPSQRSGRPRVHRP